MNRLHLEIDRRHASYITASLTRTLEQAARCGTLDQAEKVFRAGAPQTWWAVARRPSALVVSHLWQGRGKPMLCALVVDRAAEVL